MKTAKLIAAGCLLAYLISGIPAWAQDSRGLDSVKRLEVSFRAAETGQSTAAPSQDRGIASGDFIRGNGSRAGYTLSHGGVVPNSESVTVDGSILSRNSGYSIDFASGSLAFAQPVRTNQLVHVTYRYLADRDQQRSALGAPSFALQLTQNTSLGITYAQGVASANNAFDMVTYGANLQTKLGAKSTMTNLMYVSSARKSGRVVPGSRTEAPAPKPKSDSLFLHSSDLQKGKLGVQLNYQDVGKDFSGFTSMKQQNAAPNALLAQLEKEKGLRRLGLMAKYDLGSGSSSGLGWNQIKGETGDITRQSLFYGSSRARLNVEMREISEGFGSLKALTAEEQAAFGKETGMKRMNVTGDFKLSSSLQMGTTFSRVTAADAGFVKYGFTLKGPKFDVAANLQDIDPEFNRIADLTDPDKKVMATEQGMKRYDVTAHLQASKSVTVDSYLYSARHNAEDYFKRQVKNSIVVNQPGSPKFSMLRNQVTTGKASAISSFLRQRYALDHKIGMFKLNAVQDTVTKENETGEEQEVQTRAFHFDTDAKRKSALIGDLKTISRNDGTFENTRTFKLNSLVTNGLTFSAMKSVIDTNQADTEINEYSLIGAVTSSLSLKSKFAETLVDGLTVGKIRELSIVPGAARDYGMFRKCKWSLGFGEVRTADKVETQAKSARFESMVLGNCIAAEYSGTVTKEGQTPIVRSFSIVGSHDPKQRLHYKLAYKAQDPGADPTMLIRRYDADYRFNRTTTIAYNFFTYNEKPGNKIEPIGLQRFKLVTMLTNTLGFVGQVESKDNYANSISRNTLSLGISGKLSPLQVLDASFGFDRVWTPSGRTSAKTYKLKYEYQVDAEHFFTFSGKWTDWSGPRPENNTTDDLMLQLDFKTVFN